MSDGEAEAAPIHPKIAVLPGCDISPKTVLASALEHVGTTRDIVIITKEKNDALTIVYSTMSLSDLTLLKSMLDNKVQEWLVRK